MPGRFESDERGGPGTLHLLFSHQGKINMKQLPIHFRGGLETVLQLIQSGFHFLFKV